MSKYKKLFSIILVSFFLFSYSYAEDLQTELYADATQVRVGDTIQVHLRVYPPSDSQPIYTVSATAFYDTSLLRYDNSRFATINWFPLNRSPYALEDTRQGMIRKTAGYPEGLRTDSDFLIYTFTAVNPGIATISLEDGLALQFDNNQTGVSPRKVFIRILPSEDTSTAGDSEESSRRGTDGISVVNVDMNVNGDTAFYAQDDYTMHVNMPSFGENIINTLYSEVYDQDYKKVWSKDLTYTASDDRTIEFTIPGGSLGPGNYVISVKAQLSNGTIEILNEKLVGVLDKNEGVFGEYKVVVYSLFAFIVLLGILHHMMKDEDLRDGEKQLEKQLKAFSRKRRK